MVIARPEWFTRRKYAGWGAMPCTWQGWVYALVALGIVVGIQFVPFLTGQGRVIAPLMFAVLLGIDTFHVMTQLGKRDERERLHEAIAERNALWSMIVVLCAGVAYQVAQSAVLGYQRIDWFIIAAVIVALFVKAGTNLYLDRRD